MSSTTRGACPACDRGPRDKAMATTTDERGTVSYCHRCGYTAAENFERVHPVMPVATNSTEPLEWSAKAEAIWRRTQGLRGTLGEVYLEHRGCVLPPPNSDLRFLAATDDYPPSLCARVTDFASNTALSLHFTRLAADGRGKAGSEHDKILLQGHRKRGGCVRLWPDESVARSLAVAEGIESALCAARMHTPAWAAIDASNLKAFPVLRGIETLVIFADHDDVGLHAARECALRWQRMSRQVRIRRPRTPGWDVADVIAAARSA